MCKPDKIFYNKLFEKFNLNIEDSIMIGNDFIDDIEGSNNIGLNSLYINSNLSPIITRDLQSNYTIMDGDVNKIATLVIQ